MASVALVRVSPIAFYLNSSKHLRYLLSRAVGSSGSSFIAIGSATGGDSWKVMLPTVCSFFAELSLCVINCFVLSAELELRDERTCLILGRERRLGGLESGSRFLFRRSLTLTFYVSDKL